MRFNGAIHPKPARRLFGCALLGLAAVLGLHSGWADAAGTRSLDEVMHMHIEEVNGKRVSARGAASGTIAGNCSFDLVLSDGSHAAATFYGHNSHGTISGTGVAAYRVAGAISYYSGKVTGLRGTGRYAHAASRGIEFSGSVNRRTYEVKMHLRGKWHV
jgi:hypothetical protein